MMAPETEPYTDPFHYKPELAASPLAAGMSSNGMKSTELYSGQLQPIELQSAQLEPIELYSGRPTE